MALDFDIPYAVKCYMAGGYLYRRSLRVTSSGDYTYDDKGSSDRKSETYVIRLSQAPVARHTVPINVLSACLSEGDRQAAVRKSAIENTEICLAGKTFPSIRRLLNMLPGVNLTLRKGVVYFNGTEVKDLHAWIPVHGGYGPQPD